MDKGGDSNKTLRHHKNQTTVETAYETKLCHGLLPATIVKLGESASRSFLSFFVDNIRNKNTREAYMRAVKRFFDWCDRRGLAFAQIQSFHVSAYVEELGLSLAVSSVKQNLAALRTLFDWLMVRQVCAENPCHPVRGPRLRVDTGKTPVLDEFEAKLLLESIDGTDLVSLRDRALIALMVYSFARITAALAMDVSDLSHRGRRMWIRLKEKGGRQHAMPCHHKLEEHLDAYIHEAVISEGPLFRSAKGRTGMLTANRLLRTNAFDAVRRRARQAGILTPICPHTFRATGITNYLKNSGSLEVAQRMAAHADTRTTKLYDRRNEHVSLDEIERITI